MGICVVSHLHFQSYKLENCNSFSFRNSSLSLSHSNFMNLTHNAQNHNTQKEFKFRSDAFTVLELSLFNLENCKSRAGQSFPQKHFLLLLFFLNMSAPTIAKGALCFILVRLYLFLVAPLFTVFELCAYMVLGHSYCTQIVGVYKYSPQYGQCITYKFVSYIQMYLFTLCMKY